MKKRICPKCKSKNVELKPGVDQAAFGFTSSYKCQECGFEGTIFPEVEDDI